MMLEKTIRTVAEIRTHPETPGDYSTYVPIRLGAVNTAAYVDRGNTFANVISPATMDALGICSNNWNLSHSYPSALRLQEKT